MEPSLPCGHLHIVVAGYLEKTCWSHWLFDLGLTNAEVRTTAEGLLRGPCLMPPGVEHVSSPAGLAGALLEGCLYAKSLLKQPLVQARACGNKEHASGPQVPKQWHNLCVMLSITAGLTSACICPGVC